MTLPVNYSHLDHQLASLGMAEFHPDGDASSLWIAYHEISTNYESPEYRVRISKEDHAVVIELSSDDIDLFDYIDDDRRPDLW